MLRSLLRIADKLRDRGRRRRWTPSHAAGRRGEDIAHRHLQRLGMTVIARNWRREAGGGEIDIVAWDFTGGEEALVFVEVKSRQSEEFGSPDRAIGGEKEDSIRRTARAFATRAGVPSEKTRFDVVNVVLGPPLRVTHLRDVFAPSRHF